MPLTLGIASPSYSGHIPGSDTEHITWLLDRCVEYGLQSLQWGGLPLAEPELVAEKARTAGVKLVPFWNHIDLVTPEVKDGGVEGLKKIAEHDFDTAVRAGIKTIVIHGGGHDHFTKDPPLPEQISRMITNLGPVAAAAAERGLQLGLLPHLDYRSYDLLEVMHGVNNPALRMAFDTTNSFPTAEDPLDAARNCLPYAVDVALKEVRLYPNNSNRATIMGKPIGDGSVGFENILPLLHQLLPDPDNTSCHIKLRLPPDTTLADTHAWMSRSLNYLRGYDLFPQLEGKMHEELECRSVGRSGDFTTDAKL
jgi:sugar phosphate isomerase/epimerase